MAIRRFPGIVVVGLVVVLAAGSIIAVTGGEGRAGSKADEAVSRLAAIAPPAQALALEDGRVSAGELETAELRARACMEEAGFEASAEYPGEGQRVTRWQWAISAAVGKDIKAGLDSAHAARLACETEHVDSLRMASQVLHQPGPSQLREMHAWLQSCLANAIPTGPGGGARFSAYPSAPADLRLEVPPDQFERYSQCANEYEALTGFLAPLPGR